MTKRKSPLASVPVLLAGSILWTLFCVGGVSAQSRGTIDAGTTIAVRTNEKIDAKDSDGMVFSGQVEQDVLNRAGSVAIPRGADVELLVRTISKDEFALDLESITVNGQRYSVETDSSTTSSQQADGIGANKRTGVFVGGGAAIGAIIGAIAGGGKGAAIGGGIGAAAGAGTQVLTRGKSVNVPAESLLTFRLQQPLQTGVSDSGFKRNGQHYHPGYNTNAVDSVAYQDGLRAGQSDLSRKVKRNGKSNRWKAQQDLRDYETGYNNGYDAAVNARQQVNGSIQIGSDRNISWQGPVNAQLYVQVDDNPRQLFASGTSGTQQAPWITSGHLYVFTLQDRDGNVLAREQSDLRTKRR